MVKLYSIFIQYIFTSSLIVIELIDESERLLLHYMRALITWFIYK